MLEFERRFIAKEDISTGPVCQKFCTKLWLILTCLFMASILFSMAISPLFFLYLLMSAILARLVTLDLCYLVLPDIYTLPLMATGLGLAASPLLSISLIESLLGILAGGGSILILAIALDKINSKSNIGGGDIKMIAVAGSFLGISLMPIFLWVACLFSFILYPLLKSKNHAISFGPALIIALWILLTQEDILNHALSLFI
ncbi:MAG: leader peptidase (prepilin peptidase)/N-methyltransferase [Alphaproteobacteria bacterium]|jgi:leader peptidase (prepilin peptidase)/N-methyltransferase